VFTRFIEAPATNGLGCTAAYSTLITIFRDKKEKGKGKLVDFLLSVNKMPSSYYPLRPGGDGEGNPAKRMQDEMHSAERLTFA
jgi:hypothetical protein